MDEGREIVEPPKRFTVSGPEFIKDRLSVVKEEVKKIQQEHPEVLSFCMFGSMTTGKARSESDIDGYLFIDANIVAKNKRVNPACIQETDFSPSEVPRTYFTKEVSDEYTLSLRDNLMRRLNLTVDQVKHVRARPISEEIIDQHVDNTISQINSLEDYKRRKAEFEISEPYNLAARPEHPPLPSAGVTLEAMFHLEVGGGITEYRQYLLTKLEQMGDTGTKVWKIIIEGTEMMEQHLRNHTDVTYPRTLEQAIKVYGSPINH
jgi:hypothetical protein